MSFFAGSLAGALVTGGVYYGFSNLIQARTARHTSDLRDLSNRLVNASVEIPGPIPAHARIVERPFITMLQEGWNTQVANVFTTVGSWERRASDWGKRVLYGERRSSPS